MTDQLIALQASDRSLTLTRFQALADVPPELEWLANISNKITRRAYENALRAFKGFIGIRESGEFREGARSHVIARSDNPASRGFSARRSGTAWPPSMDPGEALKHSLKNQPTGEWTWSTGSGYQCAGLCVGGARQDRPPNKGDGRFSP